jgi:hypothetical protein
MSGIATNVREVKAKTSNVSFSVSISRVSGTFNVEGSLQDTSVPPSGTVDVDASVAKGSSSLTLDLGTMYGTHTVQFDTPLGTTSIPVTGVPGASINVEVTGGIDGSITTSGPGSTSPNPISWTAWGSKSIAIDASQAKDGDPIGLTLSLFYTVSISVSVTVLGQTTTLFSIPAGSLSGSPSVQARINVSSAPPIPWLYVAIGIAILVVTVVAGVAIYCKKRVSKKVAPHVPPLAPAPPASHLVSYCRYCGYPNRPNSKFCGKCGKRLS